MLRLDTAGRSAGQRLVLPAMSSSLEGDFRVASACSRALCRRTCACAGLAVLSGGTASHQKSSALFSSLASRCCTRTNYQAEQGLATAPRCERTSCGSPGKLRVPRMLWPLAQVCTLLDQGGRGGVPAALFHHLPGGFLAAPRPALAGVAHGRTGEGLHRGPGTSQRMPPHRPQLGRLPCARRQRRGMDHASKGSVCIMLSWLAVRYATFAIILWLRIAQCRYQQRVVSPLCGLLRRLVSCRRRLLSLYGAC